MKIFRILIATAPFKVFCSLLLGTLAGIGYAFLIPVVLNSFTDNTGFEVAQQTPSYFMGFELSNAKFGLVFLVSCLVILATRTLSQLTLLHVAIDTASALRLKYYNVIFKSRLSNLENVGSSRLLASFTSDVKAIVAGSMMLPELLISIVTIIGMMGYLLYVNTEIFVFICGAILFGSITFMIPILLGIKFIVRTRDKVDELLEGIRGNTHGVKELKLCHAKREDYFENTLIKVEKEYRGLNKVVVTFVRCATNYGDMMSFFIIGFMAFIFLNFNSVSQAEVFASIMVLLYITGPISVVMMAIPELNTANVSLTKAEKLFDEMPLENISPEVKPLPSWQTLRFNAITYQYTAKEGNETKNFSIGPLDFEINKGEITFVVGGNGSGKSTLAKLISSHYLADSGEIFMGNQLVDGDWVSSFRNEVTAIYTDFYLFDRLLGTTKNAAPEEVEKYLKTLKLDHVVSFSDGCFSTISLSDGQRKRLALLVSFLEDKQIYVFDEWAADQDPEFKKIFYYEILPELKSKGKAVVVVSHDDRFFDVADHMIIMERGQRISDVPSSTDAARKA
ncbi:MULTISPECIES: cyclic peptide export ABC transporter [unclassified Pseudoalteromonas]|uniref:cyclic peptide export ABC transporter n=1 Tax=unclassified Pseudoalteromonas TaxID=194690 RepID=UPI00023165B1|nr:cyclic peptide export ABC transporter [Pseudoalteromonas sp. BSi20495]GAA80877.1 hypothetical protein P20495_3399 [Pseudoalteromonas sp. BSi20495]